MFSVMVNDLVCSWPKRAKYVDDLKILEIIPRNSPSYLNCIVYDIQCFSHRNNMRLNPANVKARGLTFLIIIVALGAPSVQAELLSSASNPLNFSEFIFLRI